MMDFHFAQRKSKKEESSCTADSPTIRDLQHEEVFFLVAEAVWSALAGSQPPARSKKFASVVPNRLLQIEICSNCCVAAF